MASESLRGVVRCSSYLGDGIAHCNGEASAEHQGNIRKIIANIGDSRIGDTRLLEDFFARPESSPAVSCKQRSRPPLKRSTLVTTNNVKSLRMQTQKVKNGTEVPSAQFRNTYVRRRGTRCV